MSKDLAKEYTERVYKEKTNYPIMWRDKVFTGKDLEAAFNAGRESVLENMPKLRWTEVYEDGLCVALSSFGVSYRIEFAYKKFNLFCNSIYINCYVSLLIAKQAANEDYKERIKQALGL